MSRGYRFSEAGGGISPSVPDGSTVTPINDVETWLMCAGLNNTGYTTLAEVLSDTGVLQALINDNNAMDYLVRCKEWVSGLVPAMTSDTTPEGQCFTDGYAGDNYKAYKAFNRGDSYWAINNTTVGHYIGYIFTEPKIVNSVGMITGTGSTTSSGYVSSFRVEGSNDGSSWIALSSTLSITPATGYTIFDIDNNTSYTRYRIYTLSSQSYTYINTIQFYSSVLCSERAMYFIGQNNYAANTLLADPDWLDAIVDSEYVEYVLNAMVPVMTSNTTPSGRVFSTTIYSGYYAWYAFNRNTSNMYYSNASSSYIGYDFGKSVRIYMCKISRMNGHREQTTTFSFQMYGSTDDTNYTAISNIVNVDMVSTSKYSATIKSTNTVTPVQQVKITTADTAGTSWSAMIYIMQFYGRIDV